MTPKIDREAMNAGVISRVLCLLLVLCCFLTGCAVLPTPHVTLTGRVLDGHEPVAGALVRVRAGEAQTYSDEGGHFILTTPLEDELELTAWAPGYYIASAIVSPPAEDVHLELRDHHDVDHSEYAWIDPTADSSEDACGNCHPMILPQWRGNAHGEAVHNARFYSFYNATDTAGNPIDAPGYLKDFPGTAGNCAACHAPGAALDAPFNNNMNALRGQTTAGIHCDFCHKVGGVFLDPATNQTYDNTPGVLAMLSLRPPPEEQIFIGPYPDIHDPDTYNPLFSESDFCAPCHQFTFWGTEIYNSYGEWRASQYAADGVTCQDCHMPPSGEAIFALKEQGGLEHPPETIPSHFQLGITDEAFMQETLQMVVSHQQQGDRIALQVTLTNATAGHHVPSDHPGRHMILLVRAVGADGEAIPIEGGPRLPDWVGDLAGEAGVVYAKVLEDALTGEYPVVDYWNPTLIHSDNRIPANESRAATFFLRTHHKEVTVHVQVLFRRLFQPIAELYAWELSETLMAETSFRVKP